MKKILLICLLLSGCANIPVVTPNIVTPEIEIMYDCKDYVKPNDFTYNNLLDVIVENKKIYIDCSKLNKAKKEYIERQQKSIN